MATRSQDTQEINAAEQSAYITYETDENRSRLLFDIGSDIQIFEMNDNPEFELALQDPVSSNISQNSSLKDNEFEILLTSWGFSQDVIEKLTGTGLTLWHLRHICDSDINDLFPVTQMGNRVLFKFHLSNWRKKSHDESTVTQTDLEKNSSEVSPPATNSGVSSESEIFASTSSVNTSTPELLILLQSCTYGKRILNKFNEKKSLDEEDKRVVTDIITEHFMSKQQSMSLSQIKYYSEQIALVFPSENKFTYYIPRRVGSCPKGILYDKHRNKVSKLKRRGLIKNTRQKEAPRFQISNQNTFKAKDNDNENLILGNEEYQITKTWLRYNHDNEEETREKYKRTVFNRLEEFKNANLGSIFTEWPILKASHSHIFIDIDFEALYPGKKDALLLKWENFTSKIDGILRSDLKDSACLKQYSLLEKENKSNDDANNFIKLSCLHGILKPTARIQGLNSARSKVSIKDSQDSFAVHLPTINNLEKLLSEKRKRCELMKTTLQPFIIVEGETISSISNFYVYLDNVYLKLSTFVQCIDICFKIFQTFSLKYQVESEQVWTFIQYYFYDIKTPHDKSSPPIFNLMSRLN